MRPLPPVEALKALFVYDPETGRISRAETPSADTGAVNDHGYRVVSVKGVPYLAHRVIWALYHGVDPAPFVIDHINRDPRDNRITNLRKATYRESMENRGPFKGRKYKGVYATRSGMFTSVACGRHLGVYKTEEEAAARYNWAVAQTGRPDFTLNPGLEPKPPEKYVRPKKAKPVKENKRKVRTAQQRYDALKAFMAKGGTPFDPAVVFTPKQLAKIRL